MLAKASAGLLEEHAYIIPVERLSTESAYMKAAS